MGGNFRSLPSNPSINLRMASDGSSCRTAHLSIARVETEFRRDGRYTRLHPGEPVVTERPGAIESPTRRQFLGATAAVGALASWAPMVHAAGSDTIKIGLVGAGGRGTGAAEQALTADSGVTGRDGRRLRRSDRGQPSTLKGSSVGARVDVPKDRGSPASTPTSRSSTSATWSSWPPRPSSGRSTSPTPSRRASTPSSRSRWRSTAPGSGSSWRPPGSEGEGPVGRSTASAGAITRPVAR